MSVFTDLMPSNMYFIEMCSTKYIDKKSQNNKQFSLIHLLIFYACLFKCDRKHSIVCKAVDLFSCDAHIHDDCNSHSVYTDVLIMCGHVPLQERKLQ